MSLFTEKELLPPIPDDIFSLLIWEASPPLVPCVEETLPHFCKVSLSCQEKAVSSEALEGHARGMWRLNCPESCTWPPVHSGVDVA